MSDTADYLRSWPEGWAHRHGVFCAAWEADAGPVSPPYGQPGWLHVMAPNGRRGLSRLGARGDAGPGLLRELHRMVAVLDPDEDPEDREALVGVLFVQLVLGPSPVPAAMRVADARAMP